MPEDTQRLAGAHCTSAAAAAAAAAGSFGGPSCSSRFCCFDCLLSRVRLWRWWFRSYGCKHKLRSQPCNQHGYSDVALVLAWQAHNYGMLAHSDVPFPLARHSWALLFGPTRMKHHSRTNSFRLPNG
jgi:hypothetical protein